MRTLPSLPVLVAACLARAAPVSAQGLADVDLVSIDSLLDVRVTAPSRYPQSVSRAPASVAVITAADLEDGGYQTLGEVLAAVRGFYVSDDRNYAYLGVRGFSRPTDYNDRVSLRINGHRINENVYGSAPVGTDLVLDLGTVERIEIVRGPGAVLYGTGAMLAVIDVITRTGRTGHGAAVAVESGSFGHLRGTARAGRRFDNGLDLHAGGTWTDSDGQTLYFPELDTPETDGGVARGVDGDRGYGAHATAEYGGLRLQAFHAWREKVVPTAAYETSFNDPRTRTQDGYSFVEARYEAALAYDKQVVLRGHYNRYAYLGDYAYDLPDYKTLFTDTSDGRWLGAEVQLRWDYRSSNRSIAGAEYVDHRRADYRSHDLEEELFGGDFPFHTLSVYAQDEFQLTDELGLTAGLRRDQYSSAGSCTTPRAAVVYRPRPTTALKLLYGEAFRAPNIYEVYYESAGEAKGNPDLDPELIRTVEGVWEQRLGPGLFGALSVYRFRMLNLIDQEPDEEDGLFQFRNISSATARGVELELRGQLPAQLSATASYALQRATDDEAGRRLTNSPAQVARVSVHGPAGRYLRLGVEGRRESGRLTVLDTRTASFTLAGAVLRSAPGAIRLGRGELAASLRIGNLFDTVYSTPGGYEHVQKGIRQDGRHAVLRLEGRF